MSMATSNVAREKKSSQKIYFLKFILWLLILLFILFQLSTVVWLFKNNIPSAIFVFCGHLIIFWLLFGFVRIKSRVFERVPRPEHFLLSSHTGLTSITITLMLPVCNEPRDILIETFKGITKIDWPSLEVMIIENSTDPAYKIDTTKLAQEFKLPIYHILNRGTKAAALNDCLPFVKGEYILLLDADIVPVPEILKILVPEILQDEVLAFVQAPQLERNSDASFVSIGAVAQQIHFYEHFCEGFGYGEKALCVGSNCLFRTNAVLMVGGWPEETVTEDVAISYYLHKAGFKSSYIKTEVGKGLAPVTFSSYYNQRKRYAEGGILLLREVIKDLQSKHKNNIPILTWQIDYLFTFSFYFIAIAYLFYWSAFAMYCITNKSHQNTLQEPLTEILLGALAFICVQIILTIDMPCRGYRLRDLFAGQGMTILGTPAYLIGIINSLRRKQIKFVITKKQTYSTAKTRSQISFRIFFGLSLGLVLFLLVLMWRQNWVGYSGAFWFASNLILIFLPGLLLSR